MFRTRQAPSPTGYLHFGTARTMLFTQLIAKKNQGDWFLRLEDTDRKRLQPDAVGSLLSSMDQLGLIPDEGVNNSKGQKDDFYYVLSHGEYGPYIQSERLEYYHKYAQILIDKKLCYWSYITTEKKEELVTIKQITKKPINYYQANIQLLSNKPLTESTAELNSEVTKKMFQSIEDGLKDDQKPDLKFRIQKNEIIETNDELLGKSKFDLNLEEDFTCIKSDGYPTYHLAHPIDDYLMKTSLVIRSQEWISSQPKHIELYKALEFPLPDYFHVPFILGETGNKKMSKRDGNVNISEYLDKGYMPEAIINYLAFLGWNPGTDKELYLSPEDFEIDSNISIEGQIKSRMQKLLNNLLEDFDQNKIQKSPARFSLDKLHWFNKEYIKMLTPYEYSYRNKTLTNKIKEEGNYRIGDYAYVVDFEQQMILGGYRNAEADNGGIDGIFYPIGGGRDEGQTPIEGLTREFEEETNGTITLIPENILPLSQINITLNYKWRYHENEYNGKEMNLSVIKRDKNITQEFINTEHNTRKYANTWNSLIEVIDYNQYIRYPIWKEFCVNNSLPVFDITDKEKNRILANIFDISRVTLLTEKTIESDVVNNYSLSDPTIVTWKKITYEESLANLEEILFIIIKTLTKHKQQKLQLLDNIQSTNIHSLFLELQKSIEIDIKAWLTENNKDTGSYLWPLRIALSGQQKSPSPFELLSIIDDDEIYRRINSVIWKK